MINEKEGFTPLHPMTVLSQWIRARLYPGLTEKLFSRGSDVTGFTLVEMAVALVLSSLILVALMGTFILQGKAYTATRMSTELQNNARTALDTISSMVAMAGLGIVKSTASPPNTPANPAFMYDSAAFYFPDYTNASSIGTAANLDNFTNSTMDGTECSANGLTAAQNGGPCPPYGTDSLTFAYRVTEYQERIASIGGIGSPNVSLTYNNSFPYLSLNPGDTVYLIDPNHQSSALATVAPDSTGGSGSSPTVDFSSVSTSSAGFYNELTTANSNLSYVATTLVGVDPTNTGYVTLVNVVHVYVDYTDVNHPVLMMRINGSQPMPLADNIEDFQVQFIMDDSNPATGYNVMGATSQQYANTYASYPSFNNNFYDPTQANNPHQNPYNINAIILTLVARSDSPSNTIATPQLTQIADHDTKQLPDPVPTLGPLANYQRQIYQEIIQLPNIRTASKYFDNSML